MKSTYGSVFWRVYSATGLINVGDGVSLLAIPWLATSQTRSPALVAIIGLCGRLPWLVFTIPAGAWLDAADKHRLMRLSALVRAAALIGLSAVIVCDFGTLWALGIGAFVLGSLDLIFDTAVDASTPLLVRPDRLAGANAHLRTVESLGADVIGRPIGGALLMLSAAAPFIVNAAGAAASAVCLPVRASRAPQVDSGATRPSFAQRCADGASYVLCDPYLRVLSAMSGAMSFFYGGMLGIQVLFIRLDFSSNALIFAGVVAGSAVGALVGAQLSQRVVRRIGLSAVLDVGAVAMTCGFVGVGLMTTTAGLAVGYVCVGAAVAFWGVGTTTLRQSLVEPVRYGSAAAIFRLGSWGGSALGILVSGAAVSLLPWSERVNLRGPEVAAGAATSVIWMVCRPRSRRAVAEALRRRLALDEEDL